MAPQDHPHQHVCKGAFLWTASSNGALDATCYGVMSPLVGSYVALMEHDQQRTKPAPDSSTLHNLQCFGSAVYQHQVDPTTGIIPPPACLGIEFQRYRQAAMLQSAASAGGHAAALHQQQHLPAVARDIDIELLHADQHVSTSSTAHPSTTSSSTEAYMRHAGSTSAQPNTGSSTSSSSSSGSPAPTVEGPEYHGRPSVFERFRELHAEASERMEGKDPLWFGKAFAARAALNWESMKNMAGEVLESAKADLGLPSSKSEESE